MQSVCVLGRQPSIGLAELESLFGAAKLTAAGKQAALVELPVHEISLSRIGGTLKVCKLLTFLPDTNWEKLEQYLLETLPSHLHYIPEGKIRLGLSTYGFDVSVKQVASTGLKLKRVVQAAGRSVRVVPNKELGLNSAQIIHNQLTGPTGLELVLIRDGERTVLAQTTAVQDIDAYAARDQARPKRDARVGMLPPKLAQIIINLAAAGADPATSGVLLDPFCGTGVLLQEALLTGFDIAGTDIDKRMVDYSAHNLAWLTQQPYSPLATHTYDDFCGKLVVADSTAHEWVPQPNIIASETYLGRAFSALPNQNVLQEVMQDVDTIHRKFLKNVAQQTSAGFRMCLAVPVWKTKSGFKHLKTLDSLEELGYNRVSFTHAKTEDLIYHRENQIVGRELVVLKRAKSS